MKTSELITLLRRLWLSGFAIFVVLMILWQGDALSEALPALADLSAMTLLGVIFIQLLLWAVQVLVWRETVRTVTHQLPDFKRCAVHLAALVLGKYIPGKIWGMAARGGDLLAEGMKPQAVVQVTLYEQALILISAMFVTAIGYSLSLDAGGTIFVLCALLIFIFLLHPGARAVGLLIERFSLADSMRSHSAVTSLFAGSLSGRIHWLTALHILAWVLQGLIVVLLAMALGITTGTMEWQLIAANAASALLGFFALFAPAGIGVREAAFVAFLHESHDFQTITLLAILLRLWSVLSDILLGLIGSGLALLSRDVSKRSQGGS